jgi:hypothetical protein
MTSNIIYESHIIHFRAGATYILNSGFYVFLLWSLKIPQEQSESVNRRRTENTLAQRKRTNGQTTIYKTYIATQTVEYVISSQNLPAWSFHGGDNGSEE